MRHVDLKLTILRGPSGSGKTHYARSLPDTPVICGIEDYFTSETGEYSFDKFQLRDAHMAVYDAASRAMHNSDVHHVVLDNTNINPWEFTPYILLARSTKRNVFVDIVNILPPKDYGDDEWVEHCLSQLAPGRASKYNTIRSQVAAMRPAMRFFPPHMYDRITNLRWEYDGEEQE